MNDDEILRFLIDVATKHFLSYGISALTTSKSDASYALGILPDKLGISSSPLSEIDDERFQEGIRMLKKSLKRKNKKS